MEGVGKHLFQKHIRPNGPCLSLYHDDEARERDWDIEVCEPIIIEMGETGRVRVRILPEVASMACVIHKGPFLTIGEAYEAVMKWIDMNGYRICGPGREVYLREAKPNKGDEKILVSQSDPDTVTEIQFPIEKAG